MVRFEDKKLVIEINCFNPVESWVDLQNGLCDIVRCVKQENIHDQTFCSVIEFIQELIPDWEDAKKMIE